MAVRAFFAALAALAAPAALDDTYTSSKTPWGSHPSRVNGIEGRTVEQKQVAEFRRGWPGHSRVPRHLGRRGTHGRVMSRISGSR
ncbi:hypothetical protein [Streptomyces scopuliridis]|uniref:hypothetical protein n=1 Tax=Streptomyces scopuliridis TaxID=452529 RepID=UPI003438C187